MKVKFQDLVAMAALVGVGGSFLFFSCGREEEDASTSSETTNSDGQDVTAPFALTVTGSVVTFADGSFDAGTKVALSTTASPTEFTSNPDVTPASAAILVQGADAATQPLSAAKKAFSVAFDLTQDATDLCVLGLGADNVLRRWKAEVLKIDAAAKKVTFTALWLGRYQAVRCGQNFDAVVSVNAKGDALEGDAANNACNLVSVAGYGYCITYYGSNLVGKKESVTALEKTCNEQKGIFGTPCAKAHHVGYCVFGGGTKAETAWSWYETNIDGKDQATVEAECAAAQGKWVASATFTPTAESAQK